MEIESRKKVKDQICNMRNGLCCFQSSPPHRVHGHTVITCGGGCGHPFSHLRFPLPMVVMFPARTRRHIHIGIGGHIGTATHSVFNGGWRRGALGQLELWFVQITLRKRHGGHKHHGAGGTCAHRRSRQRAPVPQNTWQCKRNPGRSKV